MCNFQDSITEIPHGHGLSFKKGVCDALLETNDNESQLPNGHDESYRQGIDLGRRLKNEIASKVRS